MEFGYFCDRIGLPDGARQLLDEIGISENAYEEYRQALKTDQELFFHEVLKCQDHRSLFLYLYCRFACEAYEEYGRLGIGESIYWDTFSDITIWCENCLRDYGSYGIGEYDWLWRHTQCRLFRLGRLQFELADAWFSWQDEKKSIQKGQKVLNIHIPQGSPLRAELCDDALERAGEFFAFLPKETPLICHSWMLFPGLIELLPETSNIIQFQKRFQIMETDYDVREAECRIFIKVLDDVMAYPEDTGLQRNAKSYLLSGNRLGNGLGILCGYPFPFQQ